MCPERYLVSTRRWHRSPRLVPDWSLSPIADTLVEDTLVEDTISSEPTAQAMPSSTGPGPKLCAQKQPPCKLCACRKCRCIKKASGDADATSSDAISAGSSSDHQFISNGQACVLGTRQLATPFSSTPRPTSQPMTPGLPQFTSTPRPRSEQPRTSGGCGPLALWLLFWANF